MFGEVKSGQVFRSSAGLSLGFGGWPPGGRYHVLGHGFRQLHEIARFPLAREVLLMGKTSESAQELPATQGSVWGAEIGAVAATGCFAPLSHESAGGAFREKYIRRQYLRAKSLLLDETTRLPRPIG